MIQAIIKGETGKKEVGEVYVEALLEYGILLREQGDVSEALRVFFHLLIRKTGFFLLFFFALLFVLCFVLCVNLIILLY